MNDEATKPLLSILIPTYNRLSFLETTVDCFLNQIKLARLENSIEVLIGNDYQSDETPKYIREISAKNNFVQGWNHPVNLGLSGNVEFLVEKAKSEYILICGEDDLFRDGAIEYLVKCLKEKNPNFILINTSNIISSDNANHHYKIVLENRLNIDKDIFVEDFKKDKEKLSPARDWIHLTNLLPAVIFKKDLFQKELLVVKKYLRSENLWLWQASVLVGISKYGKLLVVSKPFVLHRKNESHWSSREKNVTYFNIFDNAEVANLLKDYMPSEYRKYKKLYSAFIMGGLLLDTKNGKNVRKLAWSALCKNLDCFPENVQFLSMIIAPGLINKTSHKLRTYKNNLKS